MFACTAIKQNNQLFWLLSFYLSNVYIANALTVG